MVKRVHLKAASADLFYAGLLSSTALLVSYKTKHGDLLSVFFQMLYPPQNRKHDVEKYIEP